MKSLVLLSLILLGLVGSGSPQSRETFHSIVVSDERPSLRNNRLVDYDCDFAWVAQDFGDSRDFGGNTRPGVFVQSKAHRAWLKIRAVSTTGAKFGKSRPDWMIQAPWDFTSLTSKQFVPIPLPDGGLPISGGQVIHLPDKVVYDKGSNAFVMYFDSQSNINSATTTLIIPKRDLNEAFDHYTKGK